LTCAVRTTCPYCGVGCGIKASREADGTVAIAGDPEHPANRGRLCSKGTHLGETLGLESRLLHPMIGSRRVGWDKSLSLVADRFAETIAKHGPDSVAFYVSGQLLTEDYYLANKLMKGFIGSSNIDTNSRLCMSSAVAGHVRAFGEDVVPACYDDIDEADLILLVGSNTAWCHPIVWQRIEAARTKRGTKLVVIDPRRTETAECADLHLAIRPGSDVALFSFLLGEAWQSGLTDNAFVAGNVSVPEDFWDHVMLQGGVERAADACDVEPAQLRALADLFAAHPRTLTLFSQGVNQSVQGTDKVNAILNLHLATGRIGRPGAGPFSITGQPNAMGGREVGGLASMLAAHMGFAPEDVDRVGRFWSAPNMASGPGLKAVDMFEAIREGRVKALWVMATNPAVSLPDAARVREALARCPFVVVSDVAADTDTGRFAHVRLPALAWGEKDGTVTNSERVISRQRAFLPAPGEAKPDWWIISQVARRMGYTGWDYRSAAEIFREHARLTAFENAGARRLDLGAWAGCDYDALEPRAWGGERPFADGRYSTPHRKARLVAVGQQQLPHDPTFPFILNSGRYRDQWHTMTRTGLSPRLSQHRREPLVELHPADAEELGLGEDELARLITAQGSSAFRVGLSEGQRRGEAFVPIHWTDVMASGGRAGLLAGAATDPVSGQPGFKATPVRIEKLAPAWRGFLVARHAIAAPACLWWSRAKVRGGWLYELAGQGEAGAEIAHLLPKGQRAEALDARRGSTRIAILDEAGRLVAAFFASCEGVLPPRDWIAGELESETSAPPVALLAGRPAVARPDRGPILCVCFDIGMKTIISAIADQRLTSVADVGTALGAGTNCGSCRPAIAKLIETKEPAHAVG
jgi:assimilatory nitrate reductase catalytic subunit